MGGVELVDYWNLTEEAQLQLYSEVTSREPGFHQVNPINQRKGFITVTLSPIPEVNIREYLILKEEKNKLLVELEAVKTCLGDWPEGSDATEFYADHLINGFKSDKLRFPALHSVRWMVVKAGGIRAVILNHISAIQQRLAQINLEMLELGIIPEGDKLPNG